VAVHNARRPAESPPDAARTHDPQPPPQSLLELILALLPEAEGAAAHAVVVVFDIRGFSAYSTQVDSAEAAVYLKRIYLAALRQYFKDPSYFKPTGDGMLLVFEYKDDYAAYTALAARVVTASLRFVADFSALTAHDIMLTSRTPTQVGIGIARGPATRIHSRSFTLDYSGRAINLAARLADLARPEGVVVLGDIAIPESASPQFVDARVHIRGIAETVPLSVYIQTGKVELSDAASSLMHRRGDSADARGMEG
jgi:class 3 adenylate cyclase